ncbi:hypothetical protein M1394_00060 [Candidatus Marsarchaeota archaeon]|nr:hypothetical protein [Candidatus Marsarchaeota archaeon]
MARPSDQMERELEKLKEELKLLSVKKENPPLDADLSNIIKYMMEEREKTNKLLVGITERIKKLEEELGNATYEESNSYSVIENREIPISGLDAKILGYVQAKGMACAEDVKVYMRYNGKNAACARLNKLCKDGLLDKFQLGHKVFYKYDAGKATNTLIISPPE